MSNPLKLDQTVAPLRQSRTLRFVALYALLMGLYSLLAVAKEHTHFEHYADLPSEIHAALTLVLGWLLVFRTNSAYARWWEARTLWGSLVNSSRNLSLKLFELASLPPLSRDRLQQLIIAFPRSLRDHLRRLPQIPTIAGLVPESEKQAHMPIALATEVYAELGRLRQSATLEAIELRVIDIEARNMMDVCGACERILNTRIVRSYRTFARQCVALYLLTFPWGIVDAFRWWTVPLTIITSYFMLGLETVAEHIEEPFGFDEDDLDLDAICDGIEKSVLQISR